MNQLLAEIAAVLNQPGEEDRGFTEVLVMILKHFNSETGTIHRLEAGKQELHLLAQIGLPPQLLEVVKVIPVGKGIAGQTVAQDKPVSICNLQTDASGMARPGAKQTGVGGALSVPLRAEGRIVGTLGIGTVRPHEYSAEETKSLEEVAKVLGSCLGG
jgi:putative methionine-R-sulfoxide reductase with GAF domain